VVEVAPKPWNGSVVVVHHREAKADHQNQSHEVSEVEPAAMFTGGKPRFDAVPGDHDGCESSKQVLSHAIKHAYVLLDQGVHRLQHGIEKIHSLSGVRALREGGSW
jgi:hypothetical protein